MDSHCCTWTVLFLLLRISFALFFFVSYIFRDVWKKCETNYGDYRGKEYLPGLTRVARRVAYGVWVAVLSTTPYLDLWLLFVRTIQPCTRLCPYLCCMDHCAGDHRGGRVSSVSWQTIDCSGTPSSDSLEAPKNPQGPASYKWMEWPNILTVTLDPANLFRY